MMIQKIKGNEKLVTLTVLTQSAFTCLKLTIETVKQGVIYVQS